MCCLKWESQNKFKKKFSDFYDKYHGMENLLQSHWEVYHDAPQLHLIQRQRFIYMPKEKLSGKLYSSNEIFATLEEPVYRSC